VGLALSAEGAYKVRFSHRSDHDYLLDDTQGVAVFIRFQGATKWFQAD
jgi:hypothetical protein